MPQLLRLFFAVLLFFSHSIFAQTVSWQNWSKQAFDQAESENRLLLVDLSAEWCQFCKKMDATTWQDDDVVGSVHNNYIAIRIEDEKHPALAEKFRSYGRPAFIIMDSDKNIIFSKTGYFQPQFTYWTLEAMAQ